MEQTYTFIIAIPRSEKPVVVQEIICSRCNIPRPLEDFPKASQKKLGRGQPCKKCKTELYTLKKIQKSKESFW